jgi:benzoyl-CoA-dihydrodiol lyase
VRRDRDVFSTLAEGLKGKRAKEWGLIDDSFPTSKFQESIAAHVQRLASAKGEKKAEQGIKLNALQVEITEDGREYKYVKVKLHRDERYADLTISAPTRICRRRPMKLKTRRRLLAFASLPRIDDALLHLRVNELEIGLVCLRTTGDIDRVLSVDETRGES